MIRFMTWPDKKYLLKFSYTVKNDVHTIASFNSQSLLSFQIGLVEKEWLDTLSTINPEEVTYSDYVESGQALAKELRGKGCQFIIALTHMRTPNDLRLAANASEIDLILGGHDHVYEKKEVSLKHLSLSKCAVV